MPLAVKPAHTFMQLMALAYCALALAQLAMIVLQ
jgi:hypothetical protein